MSLGDQRQVKPMGDPDLHRQLAAEVEVIVRTYAPEGDAAALESVAATLEVSADRFVVGRERARLWAVLLRQRAAESLKVA
jgi:hypothetical protein